MAQLFEFRTARFDPAAEEPNPINPIAGQALLAWLCTELRARGYEPSEPGTEDWGWYVEVEADGASHLVGAAGEPSEDGVCRWMIRIHRRRSFREWIRRAPPIGREAPLVVAIETALVAQPDFADVDASED